MAANQQPSTSATPAQEYTVRVTKDTKKKVSILKFNPANNFDFTKVAKIMMERENNYKEFKQAYDVDTMPKFGAGSEFGREAREEARKKKYGMKTRVYDPEDQPWSLKAGNDSKNLRKFKGIKEGGVLENASYYIFTQCPDGAFEALPVEEWYNFTPVARYKVLNSEEAEKEFEKREKNVNYFNIMVRKRMRGEEDEPDVDEDGKKVQKKKSKSKDFMLTELDEWAILSDDSEGSDNSEEEEKKPKKKEKKKKKPTKKKSKANSDDEALEDSDDFDEGKEVDYMTSSDSEDDVMFKEEGKVTSDKYEEKGVVEEDGLRGLIDSEDEEKEEENKEGEEDKEEEDPNKPKNSKKEGSDSESSSSSGSDSDVEKAEKDGSFASALFLAKAKNVKKSKSNESTPTSSRSGTPTLRDEEKGKKRKGPVGDTDSPMAKKTRVSTPTPGTTSTPSGASSDGINDETVRRYLMRKPMTTKELLIKFKHTGLSKEQRVTTLAQILKRLNPDKKKIKDQLYLSLKKPE